MSVSTLIAAIRAPDLPGAACVREVGLFDAAAVPSAGDHELAAALRCCCRCGAFEDCRRWIDSLPPSRVPVGVTGGRIKRAKW